MNGCQGLSCILGIEWGANNLLLKLINKSANYEMLHKFLDLDRFFGAVSGKKIGYEICNLECEVPL